MGQVLWEQTKTPYYNRFQWCLWWVTTTAQTANTLPGSHQLTLHSGGEWAGSGKGEIEDHQELQPVLIPALCTRYTCCGTQKGQKKKERKNVHVSHQIEYENVFNPPNLTQYSIFKYRHNRQSLHKQSSYLGKKKFLLLNSISKSALCPTPRNHVASSIRDNSDIWVIWLSLSDSL